MSSNKKKENFSSSHKMRQIHCVIEEIKARRLKSIFLVKRKTFVRKIIKSFHFYAFFGEFFRTDSTKKNYYSSFLMQKVNPFLLFSSLKNWIFLFFFSWIITRKMSAGIHLTNVSFSFEFYVDVHMLQNQNNENYDIRNNFYGWIFKTYFDR